MATPRRISAGLLFLGVPGGEALPAGPLSDTDRPAEKNEVALCVAQVTAIPDHQRSESPKAAPNRHGLVLDAQGTVLEI